MAIEVPKLTERGVENHSLNHVGACVADYFLTARERHGAGPGHFALIV